MAKNIRKDKDSTRRNSGKKNAHGFDRKKPQRGQSKPNGEKPGRSSKTGNSSRDWDKSYKKKPSVIKYGNKSDDNSPKPFDRREEKAKSGFRDKKESARPFKPARPGKDISSSKFEKKTIFSGNKENIDKGKPTFRTRQDASESKADRGNASFKQYRSRGDKDKKSSGTSDKKRGFKKDDRPFKEEKPRPASSDFSKRKADIKPSKEEIKKPFSDAEEFERIAKRPRKSDSDNFDKKPYRAKTGFKKPSTSFASKTSEEDGDGKIRLNKYISNAGVCSRRDADKMIEDGMIKVNGKVVSELGYKVNPGDVVKYGNRVLNREKSVYILLNKPKDFITTMDDPEERKTVMQLVKNACKERVYPVGRLDRNTTGLLLLTNDGELAATLTHPSHEVKKIYQVDLDKPLEEADLEKIVAGNIELEDGPVLVDDIEIVSPDKQSIGLEIHEGRNRIVRRIFEHLGYEVVHLDRVMYAGLTKKDLPRGHWRFLTEKELIRLKHFL